MPLYYTDDDPNTDLNGIPENDIASNIITPQDNSFSSDSSLSNRATVFGGASPHDKIGEDGDCSITRSQNTNSDAMEADLERHPSEHRHSKKNLTPRNGSEKQDDAGVRLEGRKYAYTLPVDVNNGDRATEFPMCPPSIARPHMRAFWAINVAHRATIFMWYSPVPLYAEIQATLDLTKDEIWMSWMYSILGCVVGRLLAGPACDRYGARLTTGALIAFAAVPTIFQGAAVNATTFYVSRFLTGISGGVFVTSTYWMDVMFVKDHAGRIHGFTGGVGAGIGACQIAVGLVLFPAIYHISGSREIGWRFCFFIVAAGSLLVALLLVIYSDDTPLGTQHRFPEQKAPRGGVIKAFSSLSMWVLCLQYACNFGVDLVINNVLVLYFKEEFRMPTVTAIIIGSIFPILNQAARSIGGTLSDKSYQRSGMRGRLHCHFGFLLWSGLFFIVFSFQKRVIFTVCTLSTLAMLVFFSQSCTFSIVPYVQPDCNGSVTGIVGAFGTAGGIAIGVIFKQTESYRDAFLVTGYLMIFAALLTCLIDVPGHGNMFSPNRGNRKEWLKATHSCTECTNSNGSDEEDNEGNLSPHKSIDDVEIKAAIGDTEQDTDDENHYLATKIREHDFTDMRSEVDWRHRMQLLSSHRR